jgi:S-adenosylmethionine:tRNA ribosyltransferase-isomerase
VTLDEFDYELPRERIAQHPLPRRDAARLLVLDRASGRLDDSGVGELAAWLDAGDLLVFNDTRVVPARLLGRKASGGRVELLLVERVGPGEPVWRCLLRASRKPGPGARLELADDLSATVLGREVDGLWLVGFDRTSSSLGSLESALERAGRLPLPPYIERPPAEDDRERYQTVFARRPGAVAAPTAGLHFTPELLGALAAAGLGTAWLTLHVGPGTFEPVRTERVDDHVMHAEAFEIPEATADAVRGARERGGRIVAVGTTVVRALEHVAERDGEVHPARGACGLFIRPGFRFRVVDALLTNFHLPRSTLLMLVAAFAGRERVLEAYAHAARERYRFYSYGDAMLVRSAR